MKIHTGTNEKTIPYSFWIKSIKLIHIQFISDRLKDRLKKPMSEVVETVSNKKIPSHTRCLVFELCCNDDTGEDVEVPFVQYRLPSTKKSVS